ncbi:maleylpyruvate isomerase family mycothiol-dependent enzyme [Jatrophihabitans fulvus]
MTTAGAAASRELARRYAEVVGTLTPEEWAAPSRCTGWSVQDLVAHTGSNFFVLAQPPAPDLDAPPPPEKAEDQQEMLVAARRGWSADEVRAEFDQWLEPAIGALEAVQQPPAAEAPLTLADLGTYPMNLLADAFAFDMYCHMNIDLLAPEGPVQRPPQPVTDEILAPGVGWMLAGIPQMCSPVAQRLDRPFGIVLTGPGGGQWTLLPGEPFPTIGEGLTDPAATVTSAATDFVLWGTKRADWRPSSTLAGDEAYGTALLDALNIV